jgi:ribosome modulation factor
VTSTDVIVRRARARAEQLYRPGNCRSAYLRGALACLAGSPVDSCPYRREVKKTWRTGMRLAWIRGWQSVSPPEG